MEDNASGGKDQGTLKATSSSGRRRRRRRGRSSKSSGAKGGDNRSSQSAAASQSQGGGGNHRTNGADEKGGGADSSNRRKRGRRRGRKKGGDEAKAAPVAEPEDKVFSIDLSASLSKSLDLSEADTRRAAAAGLHTLGDILFTLPVGYHDRSAIPTSATVQTGREETLIGSLTRRTFRVHRAGPQEEQLVILDFADDHGTYRAAWAMQSPRPSLGELDPGAKYAVWGRVLEGVSGPVFVEPQIEVIPEADAPSLHSGGYIPLYRRIGNVSSPDLRRWINLALVRCAGQLPDVLPDQHGLSLEEALWQVHFPEDDADLPSLKARTSKAHDVIVRSELFLFALAVELRRAHESAESSVKLAVRHSRVAKFVSLLSAPLTIDQEMAFEDIKRDLLRKGPMSRLVQADVGAGKTILAMLAALLVIENNQQVAFIVPTDVIAEKRFNALSKILDKMGVRAELLTGAVRGRRRDRLLSRLRKGEIELVLGTQALFQDAVQFRRLGLAIVEEQQFGGIQRRVPARRGRRPHLLVLTSSPVPTPLTFLQYGDLRISRLATKPEGRACLETHVLQESERSEAYDIFAELLAAPRQGFVLTSRGLKEQDREAIVDHLTRVGFAPDEVALLPDASLAEEREAVLARFAQKSLRVLVLPIGEEDRLDADGLCALLVDGAEGCALSYLNRLRARVEFGPEDGGCIFITSGPTAAEEAKRLNCLEVSEDGFELADQDLKARGLQAFLGGRRAGLPSFKVADLVEHMSVLQEVVAQAETWGERHDGWVKNREFGHLVDTIRHRWADLVMVNNQGR